MAGNQTVGKVTDNALRVLAACGLPHVDVVAGAAKPLLRPAPILCPEIHGDTGLDGPLGGPVLPPAPHAAVPGKAPVVMFERIAAAHARLQQAAAAAGGGQGDGAGEQEGDASGSSGSGSGGQAAAGPRVQLVATGALTNVALLLALYPEACGMLEVTLMGGALGVGNTHPVAEFNIQTDPEAARLVFESGVPLTMVPLEVTHTALATTSVLQARKGPAAAAPLPHCSPAPCEPHHPCSSWPLQRVRTHAPTPFLQLMVELVRAGGGGGARREAAAARQTLRRSTGWHRGNATPTAMLPCPPCPVLATAHVFCGNVPEGLQVPGRAGGSRGRAGRPAIASSRHPALAAT